MLKRKGGDATSEAEWTGTTYEYQVVTGGSIRSGGKMQEQLNQLGARGWRVVAGAGEFGTFVLMRERPAE